MVAQQGRVLRLSTSCPRAVLALPPAFTTAVAKETAAAVVQFSVRRALGYRVLLAFETPHRQTAKCGWLARKTSKAKEGCLERVVISLNVSWCMLLVCNRQPCGGVGGYGKHTHKQWVGGRGSPFHVEVLNDTPGS